ncbi:TPA_asm: LO4, partial [Leatherback sea turtle adomavirus]
VGEPVYGPRREITVTGFGGGGGRPATINVLAGAVVPNAKDENQICIFLRGSYQWVAAQDVFTTHVAGVSQDLKKEISQAKGQLTAELSKIKEEVSACLAALKTLESRIGAHEDSTRSSLGTVTQNLGKGLTELHNDMSKKLNISGGVMRGSLDVLNNHILNVRTPTEQSHAANKSYVDQTLHTRITVVEAKMQSQYDALNSALQVLTQAQ